MQAWTDESIYEGATGLCVVLVAVTVDGGTDVDEVRGSLLALVPHGRKVLHWRDDRDVAQREAILSLVNSRGIDVRATVSYPVTRRGQEAARVLGLRRLLDDLDRQGTTDHLVESRWPELDRRDRHTLNAARRDGLRRDLEMRHIDKGDDPMLWVADAAASIIAGFYAGAARGSHVWFHRLRPRTTTIHRV